MKINTFKFNNDTKKYSNSCLGAQNARNTSVSFTKFKKVGTAALIDKQTGEEVTAIVKKDDFYNQSIFYELYIGRKRIGFMDMETFSPPPKMYNDDPYQTYSEIRHIRSLDGDKYKGIGTTLINLAINESEKNGNKGAIWLLSEKGYQWAASKYRRQENPIPFYYKLGFRAPSDIDKENENLIKKRQFDDIKDKQILILKPEKIEQNSKYHEKNFDVKI